MKTKFFPIIFFLFWSIIVFKSVFLPVPISGGDYVTFWPENIAFLRNFSFFSWDATVNLGMNTVDLLHYAPYNILLGWAGLLVGDQTLWWERIIWWIPFLVLSFISSSLLVKKLFPENRFWYFAPIIFLFNTYVFMMIGGGQIAGIGLAYAVAPLVLYSFIKISNFKYSLFAGLLFAIQVMFDLRIAYVTLIAVFLYLVFSILYLVSKRKVRDSLLLFFYSVFIPLGLTGLLHAFWILPTLLFHVNTINQLGSAFNSTNAVKFFSFATFENSLSLLHPNWPENLFGKVYFMRAEFLVLPILAFSSLLFVSSKSRRNILFFALLGIIGAFLAKGANDPFGQIYLWMFDHVPGFIMFRDPTKWYLLVALAYSVLIPFSLWKILDYVASSKYQILSTYKKYLTYGFILLTTLYLLLLIRPAVLGQLDGTFRSTPMPQEYVQLHDFLSKQDEFSRTLWVPRRQRFVFLSNTHPAIDADSFLQVSSASGVISVLKNQQNAEIFQEVGIRYVILPADTQKELFTKNSTYDPKLYTQLKTVLDSKKWLKTTQVFGESIVYEVVSPKERFWSEDPKSTISYSSLTPTDFVVSVVNGKKGDRIIFADNYDPNWQATIKSIKGIKSIKSEYGLNSFVLPEDGSYKLDVTFVPQKWVNIGLVVSIVTFVMIVGGLIVLRKK